MTPAEGIALLPDEALAAQIAHVETLPAREGEYADLPGDLHPEIAAALVRSGRERLYVHQAEAYRAARAGRDVLLVTGTGSGKTLGYHLPTLQTLMEEPAARALYLFPTKALAQDQAAKLREIAPKGIRAGLYDGDTPQAHRAAVRRDSHVVLTNPDMLHVGVLPGHEYWARFFRSLRVVVVDELHAYRGVFGSHVGNVLRRLLRIAEHYRARPLVFACSATIGNPAELFMDLTGREPVLVDHDGAPRGRRTFVFYNPPEIGEGIRLGGNVATAEILATLAETGTRTLAFSRARVSAELVLRGARRALMDGPLPPDAIESYRAGYTPAERRAIETALFSGRLRGLSATNALELGVDVGGLDAVVMNGYPGTVASFWQQAGRAGRGARDGLAVFVAHNDPLDQWMVREPRVLLDARNERVAVHPENDRIRARHLVCAAHELPLTPGELDRFGYGALESAEALDRAGELAFRGGAFVHPSPEAPAPGVSLRSGDGRLVRLLVDGQELGTMEEWRALTTAHPGAVYLHRGRSFLVRELDLAAGTATVEAAEVPYYTQPVVHSTVESKTLLRAESLGLTPIRMEWVSVTNLVVGFRKRSLDGEREQSVEPLEMPPRTFETLAIRLDLPPLDLEGDVLAQVGGVHALEHALLAVAPFLAGCDRADVGSTWAAAAADTMRPAVFLYDAFPGGVGLMERLWDARREWARAAHSLLSGCPCPAGCPACLLSPRCESRNEHLDKPGALEALLALVD